jgi:5-methylcytosine-specific restriction endonuclease McrA
MDKQCSKCKETKPLDLFYKQKAGRFGVGSQCKNCMDLRRRINAAANKDRERRVRRAWEKSNLEKKKAYRSRPERKAYASDFSRKWYQENKARLKPIRAKWFEENYETKRKPAMVQHQANRRARLRGAAGEHSLAEVWALYAKQKCLCAACKQSLDGNFHRDHIVPLVAGGTNFISNIQLLCGDCNRIKGPRSNEWLLQQINAVRRQVGDSDGGCSGHTGRVVEHNW